MLDGAPEPLPKAMLQIALEPEHVPIAAAHPDVFSAGVQAMISALVTETKAALPALTADSELYRFAGAVAEGAASVLFDMAEGALPIPDP
jgi:hypothetical protein